MFPRSAAALDPVPVSRFGSRGSGKGVSKGSIIAVLSVFAYKFILERFRLQIISSAIEKSMTQREQENALADDIAKIVNRYMSEFDLSHTSIIGVLECVKLEVWEDGNSEYTIELE